MTNTDTDTTTERWTYMGRRAATDGVRHAWLDADGETRYFNKIEGAVGGQYDVDISRRDDGITLHGRPRYVGATENADADVALWRAKDREASVTDTARRAANKLKRDGNDLGSMTLADAKAYVNGFRGSRAARMAVILTYLGD